jgi:hypothetical protein
MVRVRVLGCNFSSSSHPMLKLASVKYARISSWPPESVRPRSQSAFITGNFDYGKL